MSIDEHQNNLVGHTGTLDAIRSEDRIALLTTRLAPHIPQVPPITLGEEGKGWYIRQDMIVADPLDLKTHEPDTLVYQILHSLYGEFVAPTIPSHDNATNEPCLTLLENIVDAIRADGMMLHSHPGSLRVLDGGTALIAARNQIARDNSKATVQFVPEVLDLLLGVRGKWISEKIPDAEAELGGMISRTLHQNLEAVRIPVEKTYHYYPFWEEADGVTPSLYRTRALRELRDDVWPSVQSILERDINRHLANSMLDELKTELKKQLELERKLQDTLTQALEDPSQLPQPESLPSPVDTNGSQVSTANDPPPELEASSNDKLFNTGEEASERSQEEVDAINNANGAQTGEAQQSQKQSDNSQENDPSQSSDKDQGNSQQADSDQPSEASSDPNESSSQNPSEDSGSESQVGQGESPSNQGGSQSDGSSEAGDSQSSSPRKQGGSAASRSNSGSPSNQESSQSDTSSEAGDSQSSNPGNQGGDATSNSPAKTADGTRSAKDIEAALTGIQNALKSKNDLRIQDAIKQGEGILSPDRTNTLRAQSKNVINDLFRSLNQTLTGRQSHSNVLNPRQDIIELPNPFDLKSRQPSSQEAGQSKASSFSVDRSDPAKSVYESIASEKRPLILRAALRINKILNDKEASKKGAGAHFGSSFNIKRRIKEKGKHVPLSQSRAYEKLHIPDRKDYSLCILVDVSESTRGDPLRLIQMLLVEVTEIAHKISVPIEIIIFSNRLTLLKEYKNPSNDLIKRRIGSISRHYGGDTNTGYAHTLARERAVQLGGKHRIILTLTDGYPNDNNISRLKTELVVCHQLGIVSGALGLGAGSKGVSKYWDLGRDEVPEEELEDSLVDLLAEGFERL